MKDLAQLAAYFRDRPYLTGNVAEFCKQPGYYERIMALREDPQVLARLSIHLLKHIALSPRCGDQLPVFCRQYNDTVGFSLELHTVVNFISPCVSLAIDDPLAEELKQAISSNLAGPLFAGAKKYRELQNSGYFEKKLKALQVEAQPNYDKVMADAKPRNRSQYGEQAVIQDDNWRFNKDLEQKAEAAYAAFFKPREDALNEERRTVAAQAFDVRYRGNYYDILIAFTEDYLMS